MKRASPAAVRIARPADAERIARFQLAMARETEDLALDAATVARGVQHVFDEPAIGFYVVAELAGSVCASALVLYEWSDWRARQQWWLHSVWVEPAARESGVFRALFEFVEQRAQAAGAAYLRLFVERENLRAQRVYERLGMSTQHYAMYEKRVGGEAAR